MLRYCPVKSKFLKFTGRIPPPPPKCRPWLFVFEKYAQYMQYAQTWLVYSGHTYLNYYCTLAIADVFTTSQARVFTSAPGRTHAAAKNLVQAGHVTPQNLECFLISALHVIKGGVAEYSMSLSYMTE
jgi:hypothetical protein